MQYNNTQLEPAGYHMPVVYLHRAYVKCTWHTSCFTCDCLVLWMQFWQTDTQGLLVAYICRVTDVTTCHNGVWVPTYGYLVSSMLPDAAFLAQGSLLSGQPRGKPL